MRLRNVVMAVLVSGLVVPSGAARGAVHPAPDATTATTIAATRAVAHSRVATEPFTRELVRLGDRDVDPYRIEHVMEVQLRLQRLGLFRATRTGYFGAVTERAVKTFQRHNGLFPSGIVGRRTWPLLIRQTIRGHAPAGCRGAGWHACYDRGWHQVTLFHDGSRVNSWLVRGGAESLQTRTGTFRVYYRDIDHVSSVFDTPMPYSQFFSGGQALHGSRLMMDPYVGHSHGCVNFWVEDAHQLWDLTADQPLWVHVYGRWS